LKKTHGERRPRAAGADTQDVETVGAAGARPGEGLLDVEGRLKAVAEPVLGSMGMELVLAEYLTEHGRKILRLFIDKPGGVSIDDCADVSRELGAVLDVEDLIPRRYILEVSSPGLDRPLVKETDYVRFAGRKANIRTRQAIDGRRNFKATIDGASNGVVTVTDSEGRQWELAFDNIEKSRLEFELE